MVAAADLQVLFPYNRCGMIRVLVECGADLNSKDIDGNSPAHISAEREDYEELELLVSSSWRDSRNVKGETVKSILNRRVVQAEGKRTDGWNPELLNELVEDVQEVMEALRFGKQMDVDVIETLNEKIPKALKASGFRNTMTYPAPMIRILRNKDICDSEERKLAFTKLLQSMNDLNAAADTEHGTAENDRCVRACAEHELQNLWKLSKPLLRKQRLPRAIATHADTLVWDFVKFKLSNWTAHNYIPPAPDAVKHLIRDLTSACRDNTVGEFHFSERNCGHERCEVGRQVRELVNDLVHILEELDPRLQCKLHLTGILI